MIAAGTVILPGPAGRIEALWTLPAGEAGGDAKAARAAALVCHPHPLHGGSMHNKVVHAAARALADAGVAALRFNFRGVGLSHGSHDQGEGEVADVRHLLDWLALRHPGLPLLAAGYSFGAWVALRAAADHPRVVGMAGIGLATRYHGFESVARSATPALFIQGSADALGPLAEVERLALSFRQPPRVAVIEGAAHFFETGLAELRQRLESFARERLAVVAGSGPS